MLCSYALSRIFVSYSIFSRHPTHPSAHSRLCYTRSLRHKYKYIITIIYAQSQTDAIIGWVDKAGRPFLMDTWINGYTAPQLDSSQDLSNITGNTVDGLTTLSFMRKRSTGDTKVSNRKKTSSLVFPKKRKKDLTNSRICSICSHRTWLSRTTRVCIWHSSWKEAVTIRWIKNWKNTNWCRYFRTKECAYVRVEPVSRQRD